MPTKIRIATRSKITVAVLPAAAGSTTTCDSAHQVCGRRPRVAVRLSDKRYASNGGPCLQASRSPAASAAPAAPSPRRGPPAPSNPSGCMPRARAMPMTAASIAPARSTPPASLRVAFAASSEVVEQVRYDQKCARRKYAKSLIPAWEASAVAAIHLVDKVGALRVDLTHRVLGESRRASTTTIVLTPLRPRLGVDDHRIRSPQPSSRELIGGAVHLHARFTSPVALGNLARPRGQTRPAPPDACRVRTAQPHLGWWLERPVKLHKSSWGRVKDVEIEQAPQIQDPATSPAMIRTDAECTTSTRAARHSRTSSGRAMHEGAASAARHVTSSALFASLPSVVKARSSRRMQAVGYARVDAKAAMVTSDAIHNDKTAYQVGLIGSATHDPEPVRCRPKNHMLLAEGPVEKGEVEDAATAPLAAMPATSGCRSVLAHRAVDASRVLRRRRGAALHTAAWPPRQRVVRSPLSPRAVSTLPTLIVQATLSTVTVNCNT